VRKVAIPRRPNETNRSRLVSADHNSLSMIIIGMWKSAQLDPGPHSYKRTSHGLEANEYFPRI
jgi:hypothetical protein